MENTNTSTILDQYSQTPQTSGQVPDMGMPQQPTQSMSQAQTPESMPTSSPENNPAAISTLSDIHPIPEFQGSSNKKKILAIAAIVVGVIILGATGFYYWQNMVTTQAEEATPVENAQVENNPAETNTTQVNQNNSTLDTDPVITEADKGVSSSDSEGIEQTEDDLQNFDFENIDLELQQNPGL